MEQNERGPRVVPPTLRRRLRSAQLLMLGFVILAATATTAGLLVRGYAAFSVTR
ncbi:MAG: hypothetical protein NTV23_07315 [Propionibacteriales bacterium]|nr:hypothetical protein [Propionibacteriales bacterium]